MEETILAKLSAQLDKVSTVIDYLKVTLKEKKIGISHVGQWLIKTLPFQCRGLRFNPWSGN